MKCKKCKNNIKGTEFNELSNLIRIYEDLVVFTLKCPECETEHIFNAYPEMVQYSE